MKIIMKITKETFGIFLKNDKNKSDNNKYF